MQRLSISALVILACFATFSAYTIVEPLLQEFAANVIIVDLGVLFILGLVAGVSLGLILALARRHASVAGLAGALRLSFHRGFILAILLIVCVACQPAGPTAPPEPTALPAASPPETSLPPTATIMPPTATPAPAASTTPLEAPAPEGQTKPSAEGLIAFYSDRDGNPEIYTMNADGSGLARLTDDPAFDDSPAISPDGMQIAFLAARHDPSPQFPDLKYEIYVMDVDGGNSRRLTDTEAAEGHPAWSPDGSRILFDADYDGDGFYEIYTMRQDGTEVTRLTSSEANDQFADWSPDGSRIAFSSDRQGNWDVFVMEADGSDQQPLTSSSDWELFPAWSPDGSQIAFNGLVPRTRNTDVFVMNVDGSQVRQLTDRPGFDENPAWSPDGGQIVFQTQRDRHFEIYAMKADGSEQHPLAAHPANELWPSWGLAAGSAPASTFPEKDATAHRQLVAARDYHSPGEEQ